MSRKAQHSSNIVVISQLRLLRELEELGIQLVSHGRANVQLSTLTLHPSSGGNSGKPGEWSWTLENKVKFGEREVLWVCSTWGWDPTTPESPMCTQMWGIEETDPRGGSQYSLLDASKRDRDVHRPEMILLVEQYEEGDYRTHRQVSNLPEG